MSLNLSEPLREAVMGNVAITDLLGTYMGEPSVHTRRPVPSGAKYPAIAISPDIFVTDQDFLNRSNPVVQRDVTVYGHGGAAGSEADHYRDVEQIGYELREMFHRKREALLVEGYHVVDIVVTGPIPAPTENERLIGRSVILTVRLHKN